MSQHDAENEAYHRLQNGEFAKAPKMDDGTDKRKNKNKKSKETKKALQTSSRGALNSKNMQYHEDEKFIQQYYRDGLVQRVMEAKGQLSFEDSLLIDVCAYACVRLYRKSRLESTFGRFMDRTAPQDPVQQILSILKQLGLSVKSKDVANGKDVVGKLLAQEANSLEQAGTVSYDEWFMNERSKGEPKIERRSMAEFGDDESYFKVDNDYEAEDDSGVYDESASYETED